MFSFLNIRTSYSLLKSSIRLEDLILKLKERNIKVVGINELNNIYSFPIFNSLAKKQGIKPIFSLTFENIDHKYNLSFIIKNEEGYRTIIRLTNRYNLNLKNNTSLKRDLLEECHLTLKDIKELISDYSSIHVVLSTSSPIFENLNFNPEASQEEIKFNDEIFSKIKEELDFPFLVGLTFQDGEYQEKNNVLRQMLKRHNLKSFAFPLIKTLEKEDSLALKILENIEKDGHLSEDDEENKAFSPLYYLLNDDKINELYLKEECDLIDDLLLNIDFEFKKVRAHLIDYTSFSTSPLNQDDLLIERIKEGLEKKKIDLKENPIYRKRLNDEYLTIKSMGYSSYFLIVQDYVKYAKDNNILVGPGRGSAAGSLVSYLLDITTIDPIKFDLLFERFLNKERNSMPDIDVDFQDIYRDRVISYLEEKYTLKHVSRVITFQNIMAKNAIRDVARVYQVHSSIVESLTKAIPDNFRPKSGKQDYSIVDCYNEIPLFKERVEATRDSKSLYLKAKLIERLPRQTGLHAAGVVLVSEDIDSIMPLNYVNDEVVTQYEKDYLEEQGFLKFDILGLSNLNFIQNTINLIKHNYQIEIDFDSIPQQDLTSYIIINKHHLMGLFQIDQDAGSRAIKEIKPNKFKDIVDSISLARPGPSSFIPSYVKRKNKEEKVTYLDPSLKEILAPTYGIIIYQEQIMRIAQKFSSFTFQEADIFRSAISKKKEDLIIKMKEKFVNGAIKNKHPKDLALKIFDQILQFASYGFNLSHAVSYATITSKMAYLKYNYPLEFYSSILSFSKEDTKFNKYLKELQSLKISLELPTLNEASVIYLPTKRDSLILPFTRIKDVPDRFSNEIVRDRQQNGEYTSIINFLERTRNFVSPINDKIFSSLIDAGVFDKFISNRQFLKKKSHQLLDLYVKVDQDSGIAFDKEQILEIKEDEKENIIQRLNNEYDALGILVSDKYENHLSEESKALLKNDTKIRYNQNTNILCEVLDLHQQRVKKGQNEGKLFAVLTLRHNNIIFRGTLFTDKFDKFISTLDINKFFILNGYFNKNERYNDLNFVILNVNGVKFDE